MKNKLCIILRSEYPINISNYALWSKEVSDDADTVRETLTDHDVVEIIIPVLMKQAVIAKYIKESVYLIVPDEHPYESCHIVLNTHGVPGRSDLADVAVKQALQGVSRKNMCVTQISALQCNGMSKYLIEDQYRTGFMTRDFLPPRVQKSHLGVLQQKLLHLIINRQQTFNIYGVTNAYEPIRDKELVISILLGKVATFLPVRIASRIPPSPLAYLEQIGKSIEIIKRTEKRTGNAEYDAAGNLLAIVLDSMKQNIVESLSSHDLNLLKPENAPLFRALLRYYQDIQKVMMLCSPDDFNRLYKQWLKQHKLSSQTRLEVLECYYDQRIACLSSAAESGAAPAAVVPNTEEEQMKRVPTPKASLGKIGLFTPKTEPEIPPVVIAENAGLKYSG